MKLRLVVIKSPVIVDTNHISGYLNGAEVNLTRRLDGFRARLDIRINDTLIHSDFFTDDDVDGWLKLEQEAATRANRIQEARRRDACHIAKECGLYTA